jgi:hypothetical protein
MQTVLPRHVRQLQITTSNNSFVLTIHVGSSNNTPININTSWFKTVAELNLLDMQLNNEALRNLQ